MYPLIKAKTEVSQNQDRLPQVLLIDPDFTNYLFLQTLPQDAYQITTSDNTADALEQINTDTYDAVLLDVNHDGLSTLRRIHAQHGRDSIIVLLLGSETDTPLIQSGLELGADDYLVRPIRSFDFHTRLRTQLNLKRTRAERDKALAELAQIRASQQKLMRMARHDLRHPITNIRMMETMLWNLSQGNAEFTELLDGMHTSVEALESIVSDFSSAMEIRDLNLQFEAVAVERVLYNLALSYQAAALEKSIHLDVQPGDAYALADNWRLSQAVENLLNNALKYSPPNTTVSLYSMAVSGWVYLFVQDEGPGIPQDEWDALFTEFGRVSTNPTGNETSTGLGLWIVKQLMEAMGGSVGAEFPLDGGSVFWIALPTA